jgi:hypothetical protein
MVAKTMYRYVLPLLVKCETKGVTFDLWMCRIGFDTFCLQMNFIDDTWQSRHVIIGLFEAPNIVKATLIEIMKLINTISIHIEDINICERQRKLFEYLGISHFAKVNCEQLQLTSPYANACFGHAMNKACQYTTLDDNVC